MKWDLSLPEFPMLLYYFAKLSGLAPFTVNNNRFYQPTLLGKFYPVFIAGSYVIFLSIISPSIMGKVYADNFSRYGNLWVAILYLSGPSSMVFTLITFLFMYKKIVYLMNKLYSISNELKSLGIEGDHRQFFKNRFVTIVMANTILLSLCAVVLKMDPSWSVFMLIKYYVENWFSLNTVLMFAQTLIYIKQRFTLVNERLYDLFVAAGHHGSFHHTRIFVVSRNDNQNGDDPRSEGLTNLQSFRIIQAVHLELCDMVHRTSHLFAAPILLHSFRFSTQLVTSSYWVYITIARNLSQSDISFLLCSVIRMVVPIVQLFIFARASVATCQEGNATKAVLTKVWRFRPAELTLEFFAFYNQLLHTPVTVSAFGFMELDYSFVNEIFSTVVTYLIIVIQFETSRTDPI